MIKGKTSKIRMKKHMAVLLAIILMLSMVGGMTQRDLKVYAQGYNISNPCIDEDGTVTWDKVKFGSYYQTAYFKKQPIKWRILSIDDDGFALLIADKSLDAMFYKNDPYYDTDDYISWEKCSLRNWLNNDFYETAFSAEEQTYIKEMAISDKEQTIEEGVFQSIDTMDKVTLLSYNDIFNEAYGFSLDTGDLTKTSEISDYALTKGVDRSTYDKYGDWWLRSCLVSKNDDEEDYVDSAGIVYWSGEATYGHFGFKRGVRPVIKIDLDSPYIHDAGRINSLREVFDGDPEYYDDPQKSNDVTVWDCVYFGSYMQDAEYINEPIEWRVLSVEDNYALLLSEKVLRGKEYNMEGFTKDEYIDEDGRKRYGRDYRCTWEACTLRKWLNSEFYETAFDENERSVIESTTVENKENAPNGTTGAKTTFDKVFLLSEEDATNSAYGFDKSIYADDNTRVASPTDYAYITDLDGGLDVAEWWLRDSDKIVSIDGEIFETYEYSWGNDQEIAVRPAIRVNTSSANLVYSGTVSAKIGEGIYDTGTNGESVTDVDNTNQGNDANTTNAGSSTEIPKPYAIGTALTVASAKCRVKVTSDNASNPTVAYTGTTNKKAKTITLPATVQINGVEYRVTSIADKAFSGNKKLTKVTVGKNITSIGKSAFVNCKKLKTITIKSMSLKSIGKNAFKNINKKATIKVPKKKLKSYKKLISKKKTGYKKTVKVKKY